MKLIDAPTIIQQFSPATFWIAKAAERVRKLHANPPKENMQGVDQTEFGLKQLAEDIWSIDGQLGIHTDKTRRGYRVIGLVLINEPALQLVTHDGIFPLPVGTIYHIDGRSPHGALEPRAVVYDATTGLASTEPVQTGLFGFMAWDVPKKDDVNELILDIPNSMQAFASGKKRINVLES